MNRHSVAALFAALVVGPAVAEADDWPRFRGPAGSGVASGPAVPFTWSDTENLRWKQPLPGAGSSSPIVVGDRVIVTCYSGYGVPGERDGEASRLERHVLCLQRSSGDELWRKTVPAQQPEDPDRGFLTEHGYASSTPVSDGERLYVLLGKSGVFALDLKSGAELWQADVGRESSDRQWGSASSPVLHGDLLIVNASEESQSLRAFDKRTGEPVWKQESSRLNLAYNTPVVVDGPGGRPELLVGTAGGEGLGPGELWSLNPANGKLRWYAQVPLERNVSPSVQVGGGVAYLYGGRPNASAAVRLGGRGDVTDANTVWTKRTGSYVASPLLHAGHLYWVSDQGLAVCQSAATGDEVYQKRLRFSTGGRPVYASPVLSGGRLIVPTRYDGVFVYPATPEFEQPVVNRFASDESMFNASPAVSDGELYLRSDTTLYCVAAN
ncbi:MAG: PQQ-binding-like beta-propeller repeat protein [Planctomycetota bacterium]